MTYTSKRVAIFISSMDGGGAERAMLNLARGMAECYTAVDLVLARAEGPYLADVPVSVRLVDLKASRLLTSLPRFVSYLRRNPPGAMVASMSDAGVIALWAHRLARSSIPVIINEQTTMSPATHHASTWRGRMVLHFAKMCYPWADCIVAVSKGVKEDLVQRLGIPDNQIQVIYNPVVTPELRARAQAPLDHPWFAPGQPPVILATGRLTTQKDFPTLIRAFAEVRQTTLARLCILGEGEDRHTLEGLIRQLGIEQDVTLPGFVKNPYAYMARAALFVLSSRWEGLPTVLIEALYCGAAVVSTDCPSGPREILADGQYGMLVPVGDVSALAHAIKTGLGRSAIKPPPESWHSFELETVVKAYLDLLLRGNRCAK